MDESLDLPELSKTALQKIGRNVLNLQRMEGMLKILLSHSGICASPSEFPKRANQLRESVSKKSMGCLVGEFFETIYPESSEPEMSDDRDESWISYAFRIVASKDSAEAFKKSLALLVKERNQLIHQQLLSFDLHSADSCRELIACLDDQNLRIRPVMEDLRGHVEFLASSNVLMGKLLASGEFQPVVEDQDFEQTSSGA